MLYRLIELLEHEVNLYKELLTLIQDEKRLLSRRKKEELHRIVNRIETLVFKIKGVEGVRDELMESIADEYNIKTVNSDFNQKVNLSQLIGAIKEAPQKDRLRELKSNLLAITDGIKMLNKENSVVITRNIENIKSAFLFLKEFSASETYKPSGELEKSFI